MNKLTLRQKTILEFVRSKIKASNREIKEYLEDKIGKVDRATIVRDIDTLIKLKLLVKEGAGRSVVYSEKTINPLLTYFDPEEYFKTDPDKRGIAFERFNFQVFNYFSKNFILQDELKRIDDENKRFQDRVKKLSPAVFKKEYERLTVELSWKSSQIEGNTYSLLDTEFLIKENREAEGHSKEEAIMILNHKQALDYVMENKKDFKKLSLAKIENIHKLIVKKLGVKENIRQRAVGITGTKFRPLDNKYQITEAMEKMIAIINSKNKHPIAKALSGVILVSYIQPFEDGNKRTARLLGNAILIANDYCPLSYRSIEEKDYKKATLLFYEQNSVAFFKKLFIEQFEFSVNNYFL